MFYSYSEREFTKMIRKKGASRVSVNADTNFAMNDAYEMILEEIRVSNYEFPEESIKLKMNPEVYMELAKLSTCNNEEKSHKAKRGLELTNGAIQKGIVEIKQDYVHGSFFADPALLKNIMEDSINSQYKTVILLTNEINLAKAAKIQDRYECVKKNAELMVIKQTKNGEGLLDFNIIEKKDNIKKISSANEEKIISFMKILANA